MTNASLLPKVRVPRIYLIAPGTEFHVTQKELVLDVPDTLVVFRSDGLRHIIQGLPRVVQIFFKPLRLFTTIQF